MYRCTITGQSDTGDIETVGWYDQDRATTVYSDKHWNGSNNIDKATGSQWDHEYLHRTAGGRWVLQTSSDWQGAGADTHRYLDDDEARGWVMRALDPGDELETLLATYWPDTPDEVAYGRPPVGPQVQVRMSDEMREACDEAATAAGITRAEWIRRTVDEKLRTPSGSFQFSSAAGWYDLEAIADSWGARQDEAR